MPKLINFGFIIQVIISLVIVGSLFVKSARNFMDTAGLSEEKRKELIYGDFYRSMRDYIKQIPLTDNAAIIEPPGERAELFWILNYYFLPRKIYTFPDASFLNSELIRRYNIKFMIKTTVKGFYFERL